MLKKSVIKHHILNHTKEAPNRAYLEVAQQNYKQHTDVIIIISNNFE
jgi:hypothetical protein